MAAKQKADPDLRVDKRRVTMTNRRVDPSSAPDAEGRVKVLVHQAVDYVRPDVLGAYVEHARLRWDTVEVSDEPDAGPAGYDGATSVPFGVLVPQVDRSGALTGHQWQPFPHELAGTYFPATDCKNCKHAPEHPVTGEKARIVRGEG